MVIVVASMLANGTPHPPSSPTVIPPEDTEGTALRQELRALREALDAERAERHAILEELRRSRPSPVSPPSQAGPTAPFPPPPSQARMGSAAIVDHGERVTDLVAFGDDVIVRGTVLGSATSFGGDVSITRTGIVYGDAVSFGGAILVEPGGRVDGDRVALDAADAALDHSPAEEPGWFAWLYHRILVLLSLVGASILVVGLFPARVTTVAAQIDEAPVLSSLLGAAFATLTVVVSTLFMLLTLGLGAPVSAVALAVLGAAWLLGFVSVCQVIGDRLPMAAPNGRWAALVGGSTFMAFAGSLGLSGVVLAAVVSMLGIGATFSARFGSD